MIIVVFMMIIFEYLVKSEKSFLEDHKPKDNKPENYSFKYRTLDFYMLWEVGIF